MEKIEAVIDDPDQNVGASLGQLPGFMNMKLLEKIFLFGERCPLTLNLAGLDHESKAQEKAQGNGQNGFFEASQERSKSKHHRLLLNNISRPRGHLQITKIPSCPPHSKNEEKGAF